MTKLLFSGKRCIGVEYRRGGATHRLLANREVVLCGGVYNSPQLLQLSGIGDPADLRAHGIEVLVDRPAVGRNYRDHMGAFLEYNCLEPVSLYRLFRPDRAIAALLRAKLFGTGPASVPPLEGGGMVATRPGLAAPDIELTFIPGLSIMASRKAQGRHGFIIAVLLLHPETTGSVRLRSSDPHDKPVIEPNFMAAPADVATMREGVKIARRIGCQPALSRYRGDPINLPDATIDDDDLDQFGARFVQLPLARDWNLSYGR